MKSIYSMFVISFFTMMIFSCAKEIVIPEPTFDYSSFTDSRDGKTYKTIKIGNQEWMAENLAYKTANGSWYVWDSETEGAKYGRLYTWDAAKLAVPAGWHLPTDQEWKTLEMTLGMSQTDADKTGFRGTNEGGKLKSTKGWNKEENGGTGNGTNSVGFSALPGGTRTNSGNYFVDGWYGYWWSATETDPSKAWMRYITYYESKINRNNSFKEDAYSVRCIKD